MAGVRLGGRADLLLDATLGVRVPTTRNEFYFTPNGVSVHAYQAPVAVGYLDVSAGLRFW